MNAFVLVFVFFFFQLSCSKKMEDPNSNPSSFSSSADSSKLLSIVAINAENPTQSFALPMSGSSPTRQLRGITNVVTPNDVTISMICQGTSYDIFTNGSALSPLPQNLVNCLTNSTQISVSARAGTTSLLSSLSGNAASGFQIRVLFPNNVFTWVAQNLSVPITTTGPTINNSITFSMDPNQNVTTCSVPISIVNSTETEIALNLGTPTSQCPTITSVSIFSSNSNSALGTYQGGLPTNISFHPSSNGGSYSVRGTDLVGNGVSLGNITVSTTAQTQMTFTTQSDLTTNNSTSGTTASGASNGITDSPIIFQPNAVSDAQGTALPQAAPLAAPAAAPPLVGVPKTFRFTLTSFCRRYGIPAPGGIDCASGTVGIILTTDRPNPAAPPPRLETLLTTYAYTFGPTGSINWTSSLRSENEVVNPVAGQYVRVKLDFTGATIWRTPDPTPTNPLPAGYDTGLSVCVSQGGVTSNWVQFVFAYPLAAAPLPSANLPAGMLPTAVTTGPWSCGS